MGSAVDTYTVSSGPSGGCITFLAFITYVTLTFHMFSVSEWEESNHDQQCLAAAGVARLSAAVGRSRVRRHRCPSPSTRQSLEAGYCVIQQVSTTLTLDTAPFLLLSVLLVFFANFSNSSISENKRSFPLGIAVRKMTIWPITFVWLLWSCVVWFGRQGKTRKMIL